MLKNIINIYVRTKKLTVHVVAVLVDGNLLSTFKSFSFFLL